MKIEVLKSKIRIAIVTDSNPDYRGSITIDEELMEAADLREFEKVEINARDKDVRIKTYVLKGKRGSGCIEANGGLSQYLQPGDVIHILSYAMIGIDSSLIPTIVDSYNNETIIFDKNGSKHNHTRS